MKPTKEGIHIAQYIFFALLGIVLLYLAFKGQSYESISQAFQQVDWRWPILIMGISIINYISRAMRWQILIAPLKHTPSTTHTFISLMIGYLVNLAVPRLGELSRCETLRRLDSVPFKQAFGTVIIERIIDLICLGIVVITAIIVEYDLLLGFYMKEIYPHLAQLFAQKTLGIRIIGISTVVLFALGLAYFLLQWKQIRKSIWGKKVWIFSLQVWKGIIAISRMQQKGRFIAHTLFIWLTYYLMTFLWFNCFEDTSHLGWQAGLTIMLIGTIARTLPIQGGGVGAYHYLFAQGMLLYGTELVYAQTLAIMIHGLQIIIYLAMGSISMLYVASRIKVMTLAEAQQIMRKK